MAARTKKIVRVKFPKVYEYNHRNSGIYYLVDVRSKKWGMDERRTFPTKSAALKHADEIENRLLKFGAQTEIPKEKIVKAEEHEHLAQRVSVFGVSLEDAIKEYVQLKGAEITKQAKPSIGKLLDDWKAFKYTKKDMSDRFRIEIKSYTRFLKNQWGELKPDEVKRNDIELLLNNLDVCNNTRRKYLLFIRMFFKWVMDEGHILKKPTDGIRITADEFKGEFYTPNETKQVLRYVAQNHRELVGYYALLAFAGLRPSEGKRVQWEDFNFKTNQLLVQKGKTHRRHVNLQPVLLEWIQYQHKVLDVAQIFPLIRWQRFQFFDQRLCDVKVLNTQPASAFDKLFTPCHCP